MIRVSSLKIISLLIALVLIGCGENKSGNHKNKNGHNSDKTVAYYGDKENNLVVVVDVENMRLVDSISTGHQKTYAVEVIKTRDTKHSKTPKMYIDNRGSDAIDVFDASTYNIIKTIDLPFYPRSLDTQKEIGLVAVSGTNKPMTAIIDSRTDSVISIVGDNTTTYPTTSGHDYISSGTLASGHPHWLDETHFVLIDRQKRKIITYKIEKNGTSWETTKVNEIDTPSPVHNLIPPEIHGQHGRNHNRNKHGDGDLYLSTIFYATAEGATGVYPSILKLEFIKGEGLKIIDELKIQKEGLLVDTMGVHHLNFLKDQKTIYVGSDEGTLFVVDYTSTPMSIIKTVQAGKGAGHTEETKHDNIAVVINHKDKFITVMDTLTHTKIADIEVSNIANSDVGVVQTQSHPQYHFSKYGKLAMGSFVH